MMDNLFVLLLTDNVQHHLSTLLQTTETLLRKLGEKII